MDPELRPVTEQDLPALLDVYRNCEDFLALGPVARASADMVLADLAASRERGGTFCGIADASGRLVGVADYTVPTGEFDLLMIAAEHRRCGLGTRVADRIEGLLRGAGCGAVRAGVQVNNPLAARFWNRRGYRVVSGPRAMPDGTTVWELIKDLGDP